jgi:hypothetical protein
MAGMAALFFGSQMIDNEDSRGNGIVCQKKKA